MKIGVHSCMLERRYPLPEALAKAAELGFASYEIDLGIGQPGERWEERRREWRARAGALRSAAAEAGVALSSLCLGVLWQASLASADEDERDLGVRIVRDATELAAELGATTLLLPVGQPRNLEPARARANVIDSVRLCLPSAEATGVVLALENVCQRVLYTADDLLEVVDVVASPLCGVYYDPGNQSFIGVDPVPELHRLGGHVVRVHLKDTLPIARTVALPEAGITGDFSVWERRTTVTLGSGEVKLGEIRQALTAIGYDRGVVLELPQPPERAEEGCRANLFAATRLFAND